MEELPEVYHSSPEDAHTLIGMVSRFTKPGIPLTAWNRYVYRNSTTAGHLLVKFNALSRAQCNRHERVPQPGGAAE